MTPEHWQNLAERLGDALESPDPRAFAKDDPELRRWIDRHAASEGWLDPFPRDPLIGTRFIGRYELTAILGRGGAGVVYLAADTQIAGRMVVVKLMHDFWSGEAWMRRKFQQEAQVLSKLDHPGIISLLDAGETPDGRLYLLMPHRQGRTLREALRAGRIDTLSAARWVRKAGDAVSYAHGLGILHRDLKPENILLVADAVGETPMLLDFGIAHVADPTAVSTTTTHLMGSAFYMAPEHLLGRPEQASDLYSLAVITWEMLTGRHPFAIGSPFALLETQKKGVGDSFYRQRPDLGLEVGRQLARALEFDPQKRPTSAKDFFASLADAIATTAVDLKLARLWKLQNSRRWMLAGGGAALVSAVGGGWFLRDRWKSLTPADRTIQYRGGISIEDNGFTRRMNMYGEFALTPGTRGFKMCRYFTTTQGHASHALTLSQKREAFRKGWRFRASLRPELAAAGILVDAGTFAPRFDMALEVRNETLTAIALTGLQTGVQGPTLLLEMPSSDRLIDVEIKYNPTTRTALVLAGGKIVAENYAGHSEYRENLGIDIFISVNDQPKAQGLIGDASFEILG